MSLKPLEVLPQQRDGQVKSLLLRINDKVLLTPNFSIRPSTKKELDVYLDLKSKYKLPFTSSYVVRFIDAYKILNPFLNNLNQTTLLGTIAEQKFIDSLLRDLVMIDPSLEYLYYKGLSRFFNVLNLPRIVSDFVNDCLLHIDDSNYDNYKSRRYTRFLNTLINDSRSRIQMVRDFLRLQVDYHADILIPPVPLIDSFKSLKISNIINKVSKEITRTLDSRIECATYFLLNISSLRNIDIMNEIKGIIDNDASKVTVFKIKYLNLNSENYYREREIFKELMQDLALISQLENNKIFILLESHNQTFPSSVIGFDIVSSSFNGDNEYRRSRGPDKRSPWGYYYDRDLMIFRDRDSIIRTSKSNNNRLNCYCPVCQTIYDPEELSVDTWNQIRKPHYIFCRHDDLKNINEAIPKGESIVGAIDKIKRSQLKYLVELF